MSTPTPMITKGKPADWVFIFKFNADSFPECDGKPKVGSPGIFGGKVKDYKGKYSQQYIFASDKSPKLTKGKGCLGATLTDPLGATFDTIYNNDCFYVMWNDQFYDDPISTKGSPWGHSKGVLAWDENGDGVVLQVSTPSWPGSASKNHPRKTDGNTLGTINDDDIEVSQHFFALKVNKKDVAIILTGLQNASIVTKTSDPQIVNNGGPADIQALVKKLGKKSKSTLCTVEDLSSGVKFISKPSELHVPPWQLVSSHLDSIPLRVASWWAHPEIPSTDAASHIGCWASGLHKTGAIDIATTGTWDGKTIGLKGGPGIKYNHAKIAVSTDKSSPLSIFGDMNQQGAIRPHFDYPQQNCGSSQNGRGGTFYALNNKDLFASMTALLKGESAVVEEKVIRDDIADEKKSKKK